jgi:DNA-binding FadR family transcriptional regulator
MSLIDVRHGSGTFVTAEAGAVMSAAMTAVIELEQIGLLSILELSEAFYLKSIDLAIEQATDEEIANFRHTAGQFEPSMKDEEFSDSLRAYLLGLVALSHNRLLITIAGYLIESQIALAQEVATVAPSVWRKIAGRLIKERLAIADALVARDHAAAEASLRQYMKRGRELVAKHATGQIAG